MEFGEITKHLRTRTALWTLACSSAVLVILTAVLLPLASVMALVGLLVCAQLGITLASRRDAAATSPTGLLEIPFWLARDDDVFPRYRRLAESLLSVSQTGDPIYRQIALEQLDQLAGRVTEIAEHTLVFEGTEAWRMAYERLLRSPGLCHYRSVAWVTSALYWQDEPGRKTLAVNFELQASGRLTIERIAIIADELWPTGDVWPAEPVRQWLHEQYARGIGIRFVRQAALFQEPELIHDIGIYGSRALGVQQLDEQGRTIRFTLTFDFAKVTAAEERWQRLSVYAESWGSYLERYELFG